MILYAIFESVTITDVVLIVAATIVGIATWRARSIELWKTNYEAERTRLETLQQKLVEKESELNGMNSKIIALEQRPDYTTLLQTQNELFQTVKEHHTSEQEIWGRVTAALDIIINRLQE